MRRGHPGIGGWRGDNPRHFRPRGGQPPHFRPPMKYGSQEPPRFPPGPRFRGPRPFITHTIHSNDGPPDQERPYRGPGHFNNHLRPQGRGGNNDERSIYPILQKRMQDHHVGSYNKSQMFYEDSFSTNNMGDVDHRNREVDLRQQDVDFRFTNKYGQPSPWMNQPFERIQYHNDKGPHNTPKQHGMGDGILPLPDLTGHRPPSSDHYSGTSGPNNNNNPYSRSVDDTVDIVRRRLMNRDSKDLTDNNTDQSFDKREIDTDMRKNTNEPYHDIPREQPVKKRVQRHRQEKLSCDKMKNNIVHQLFKMDKGKIHKLMDNPNSSSKFEYAISSLITESQNSFNRHLRSVAEKSLTTSNTRSDFINDNNYTIYEDTFMREMQGVLDPQDTVLLEDIKPLVLAELSKVLCLDDFECVEDTSRYQRDDSAHYNDQHEFPHSSYEYDVEASHEVITGDLYEDRNLNIPQQEDRQYAYSNPLSLETSPHLEPSPLFERRPPKQARKREDRSRSQSTENWQTRRSVDSNTVQKKSNDEIKDRSEEPPLPLFDRNCEEPPHPLFDGNCEEPPHPLFDGNCEEPPRPLFDGNCEEPPRPLFDGNCADLPRPLFDGNCDDPSRPLFDGNCDDPSRPLFDGNCDEPSRPLFDGNCDNFSDDDDPFADLDNQYHVAVDHTFIDQEDVEIVSSIPERNDHESRSPPNVKPDINVNLPMPSAPSNDIIKEIDTQLQSIAKSPIKLFTTDAAKVNSHLKIKEEIQENVAVKKETLLPKCESEMVKVKSEPMARSDREPAKHADSGNRNSRKRSVDTKPAHRKEKRKKSSHSESHEEATSIYNMFYVQKPPIKDDKNDTADKKYSDKYVKRKESHSKEKSADASKPDTQKKQNSHSSHSNTSPKTSSSIGDLTPSKIDKTKLTAIDIFSDGAKPKKGAHQAHRNTSTPLVVAKGSDENKIKPIIPTVPTFARKLTKRHVGTQFYTRLRHKECQTAAQKKINSGTQTSPVKFQKNHCESTEPLERMKEIDMEIQMLLQEKFKLYNSLESKNKSMSSSSTMGTLGMAVLNVPVETDENKEEDDDFLANSIAEEFTNLPVEELEEIAMETFENKKNSGKPNRRQKVRQMDLTCKNSESPTTRKKKAKNYTPNISLLEQIISNDRPLEEIISLDDLERTPKRSKKKSVSKISKKKTAKKVNSKPSTLDLKSYNLKECSVVIEHLDISEYLKKRSSCLKIKINLKALVHSDHETATDKLLKKSEITERHETILPDGGTSIPEPQVEFEEPRIESVEEPNDIQIDMMEVCEDIVIGDEIKTVEDVNERVPISEDIILDNSQSSAEYSTPEITEGECKMYDYSTDDTLKRDAVTVTGNADAVLAIECIDNSFIAACLDGNVYHFSTDGKLVSTLRGSNLAVTCLTIVKEKYGTTVYTGSLDSRIRYYDLDTGLEKGPECNVLSPIQTMDRAWDTIFVGTRTGFVLQFECKNNMLIPVSTVKFSEQSILALRAMKEGPRKVLLVAARSDNVTVKDAQTGLLLRTLEGPKMTVYSLLFEDGKVYCGTSSNQIHVFDYSSGSHVHVHEGGKGAVCLRATGGLVFAGCYDGCVYVYREGESRPLAQLRGPALMLLSLAIQGTKIIAGYKDRSLFIWKIPLAVLQEMIL